MKTKASRDLLGETREAAIAIFEDFSILRDISTRLETRPVHLRHASAVLRRWLVENQIARVAAPRVGRLKILAIDNNPVYRFERSHGIVAFVTGGAQVHGVYLAGAMMSEGRQSSDITGYHPDILIPFGIETFLKQRVIYSQGEWFTRLQVVKFVANADNGVHGHGAREDWEKKLSGFRQEVSVNLVSGPTGELTPSVNWRSGDSLSVANYTKYDPSLINALLLEVVSAISFLVKSPDLVDLIDVIKVELGYVEPGRPTTGV